MVNWFAMRFGKVSLAYSSDSTVQPKHVIHLARYGIRTLRTRLVPGDAQSSLS
jgi:hypothetical protein